MGVIEWLCDIRFHRSLVLPPNPETNRTKPLRVSYADYGDKDSDAVVLFCGALMGMRMCYSPLDQLAKLHRVRIIHPDRPGVGGSDPVTQQERIAIWLEIVPHLLQHLRIPYVSLASHSGGDIYLLNTVLTHPHLLHPKNPYVTFFAPWVHHSHSGVSSLRATELLPAPLIGKFASVARFVNQNVVPLAGLSGTLLHGIRDSFTHSTPAPAPVPLMPTATDGSGTTPVPSRNADNASDLDLNDPKIVEELRMLIVQYLFAEQTEGVSMDAQLFLKKPQTTHWCSPDIFWSDIDDAVPLIKKLIRDEGAAGGGEGRNWMFTSFHAEEDSMVGEKGRTWFDACWTKDADGEPQDDAGDGNGKFRYESKIVPKSDHNYLMDPAFQASNIWLEGVRAAFPPLEEV
ncbi:hypothetical protein BU24DRAFT_462292 [Aaosphaeria arxii CBS 175.79]|uniref:AB hydrolase-1 domain-containing protein n=1 Tax=Aaosphaeria arxii CBS 175.79 TaxID=1450172 RepID=A0A6A5XSE1_9PLEO|nr:uncharacterized protein BU24DRAFT_462292 [Aaosphaeria arxii CBS 175.79]KAF2016092.1 hypothetical protein BU24DRAFT_462292 [Aaosphaeria arxii CBS 175.79]